MPPTTAREADRIRLSRAAVIDRALALSDADGLDAVTIRRLATELGVSPMALYWHFRSKEELLAGLADRVWAQIDAHADPAAPWPAQLRGLLESLVRVLREHPSASTLLLAGEKMSGEAALAATETTLGVLRQAGFNPDQAAAIARNALYTGLMLVMSQPGLEPGMSDADCAEAQRRRRVRLALLPPDRYPHVIEAAGPLTGCDDPDQHYTLGIDLFVAGVQAIAPAWPPRPQAAPTPPTPP
jgi:TetR/AcrR family transcriptional regulator, tetracycline repressor protein